MALKNYMYTKMSLKKLIKFFFNFKKGEVMSEHPWTSVLSGKWSGMQPVVLSLQAGAWVASQRHLSINLDLSNPIVGDWKFPHLNIFNTGESLHMTTKKDFFLFFSFLFSPFFFQIKIWSGRTSVLSGEWSCTRSRSCSQSPGWWSCSSRGRPDR